MTRSRILLFLASLLVVGLIPGCTGDKTPPNILFILFDDLGYGALGAYGSDSIRTPNIDALSAEGMRFTQFYANAPVCSPTRVSMLTGQYPARFGIRKIIRVVAERQRKGVPADAPSLPAVLKQRGYVTGHVGKWHLGRSREEYLPENKGFDETVTLFSYGYMDNLVNRNGGETIRLSGHLTEHLKNFAIDFIRRNAPSGPADPPFFLNLWLLTPHEPLNELPARPNGDPYPAEVTQVEAHTALMENADRKIGEILDELTRLGILDDTIVVIASDNGGYKLEDKPARHHPRSGGGGAYATNGPLALGKRQLFEGGIRVPMIVRWPGQVPPNTVNDSVVVGTDFLPTFADIADIDTTQILLDGESFLDTLLSGKKKRRDGLLFWESKRTDPTFAVRKDDWKFIHLSAKPYLFDMSVDVTESNNLAAHHPELVEELSDAYLRWRQETARIHHRAAAVEGDAAVEEKDGVTVASFAGDGRISLEKDARLDFNVDDFTFSTWLSVPPESFGDMPRIIAMKANSWRLLLRPDGRISLTVRAGRAGRVTVLESDPIAAKEWYHVAFTLYNDNEGAGNITLYVRKRGDAPGLFRNDDVPHRVNVSAAPVLLGNNSELTEPFAGSLFDLRFYHASLCEETISADCPLLDFTPEAGLWPEVVDY